MANKQAAWRFAGGANKARGAVACAKPFGIPVVAYGTGNVVALALAGQRLAVLQEIPIDAETVSCVAWSGRSGRLAVCGGKQMFLFEPVPCEGRPNPYCPYTWKLCAVLKSPGDVLSLSWAAVGSTEMVLVAGSTVALWHAAPPAPPSKDVLDEEESEEQAAYNETMKRWARRFDTVYTIDDSFCAWSTETAAAQIDCS